MVDNGSFEHVGQFYVAGNGHYGFQHTYNVQPTDYFGYAPVDKGTYNGPYLGSGIQGASPNNGGTGAATPTFGNIVLTNTGNFPLAAGMEVYGKLIFGTSAGTGSSIITIADGYRVTFRLNFPPFTGIEGANDANYIDGYAGYDFSFPGANTDDLFLPLGDSKSPTHPYHPITVSYSSGLYPPANMQARYLHTNPLPVDVSSLGPGIGAVSTVGYWKIPSSGSFTSFFVSIPQPVGLGENINPANLRLVGWNGSKWVLVGYSGAQTPSSSSATDLNGYLLGGSISNHNPLSVSALAIGITGGALPVKLISFTGRYEEGVGARLYWQTSMEANNDRFDVQRSSDAKSFETVGQVTGRGSTQVTNNYTFTDAYIPTGTSYYRLKQVDQDGSYTFSSILAIQHGINDQALTLTVSPNPTQRSLRIDIPTGEQIDGVSIYDLRGHKVRQESSFNIDVTTLPIGNYLLDIHTVSGKTIRQRFIKN